MQRINKLITYIILFVLLSSAALAQSQPTTQKSDSGQQAASPVVATVSGGGTPGQITKWISLSTLGDSLIFEDKFGKVGIGTKTPTSLLTVQGMIETTLGGMKFPDGTVQTTAALSSIFHDATLAGNGTTATPLSIAPGGVGTNQLANNSVTAPKIASGQVVKSLNGLFDQVTLQAGQNITITPTANTLTIAASGASVLHDDTLTGDGSAAMRLGLKIPLTLQGNSSTGAGSGGSALTAFAGSSDTGEGGTAISAGGGLSNSSTGGIGVKVIGGTSNTNIGGIGVSVTGGASGDYVGGVGVKVTGGSSNGILGGDGINTQGGSATGAGNTGGTGILAEGGFGFNGATRGLAGEFRGNVRVIGNLSKSGGSFKIDHPLDPENKYLYHSFVESPDMKNIYDGNVVTDVNGDAVIELPDYFEALNRDFRYQLTVIGQFAQAIVADEIKGNRFAIKTNAPSVKVSWQVTGIRQDAWANKNRIQVEEDKPEAERGYYLHPAEHGKSEEKSVLMVQYPEAIRQIKEAREKAQKEKLQ